VASASPNLFFASGEHYWKSNLAGTFHRTDTFETKRKLARSIRCYENIPENWEEESQAIRTEIADNIQPKQMDRQKRGLPLELIEADLVLTRKAEELFGKTFSLARGEYVMHIGAIDSAGEVLACQAFRFLLFENDLVYLQKITKHTNTDLALCFHLQCRPPYGLSRECIC
jgi:hypothetical protein